MSISRLACQTPIIFSLHSIALFLPNAVCSFNVVAKYLTDEFFQFTAQNNSGLCFIRVVMQEYEKTIADMIGN